MKKIMILTATTGGGHRAGALAIAAALDHLYGDELSTSVVDVCKRGTGSPLVWLDGCYRWLATDGQWLWKMLWWTDGRPWIVRWGTRLLTPVYSGWLSGVLRAGEPDLVVTVHGLINHVPQHVLHKKMPGVPFVTVVIELVSAHPVWFCPEVERCVVPTEAAHERAVRFGMPAEKVEMLGLPVDLRFLAPPGDRAALRARLQLDPSRPCVLAVGGGDGVGSLYDTARALATNLPHIQLVVVAGRNESLRRKLERTAWEVPTQIHGFVENMPELMSASDLLVTKAGSVTLAEAFVAGLPVIIYGFLPGQEAGNIPYVLEHHVGAYTPKPDEIARIARAWLRPDNPELVRLMANARALAHPEASLAIARRLYSML